VDRLDQQRKTVDRPWTTITQKHKKMNKEQIIAATAEYCAPPHSRVMTKDEYELAQERKQRNRARLAIKLNNCATNDPCALCGQRTDPRVGPELFIGETFALVCHQCGRENAPELMLLLELQRVVAHTFLELSGIDDIPC
jgi:hypothetical protein